MSEAPTVGLALIVRDEEKTLPTLLASIEGAFDQVVLLDTGSKDDTVNVFFDWAKREAERHSGFASFEASAEWTDDFAAARTQAHALLDTDWEVWADADDVITGAQRIRSLISQAPPELNGFVCGYDYAQDEHGNCLCYLKRERIVRAGKGTWGGRVHEAQAVEPMLMGIGPEVIEWVHRKPPLDKLPPRNLRILRDWQKDEPENPRVLAYLGTEYTSRGKHATALRWYKRYLALNPGWDEERAQVHRKLAVSLIALNRHPEAQKQAVEAMVLLPKWPESYLTLAETSYHLGDYEKAIEWCDEVLRRGMPDTLLIVNPRDFDVAPLVIAAGAYAALGQIDAALVAAEKALAIMPGHPLLAGAYPDWRAAAMREHTAKTFLACAEMLVRHDEQLKALEVLRSVPHYAIDHPQVCAMRSALRERIDPLFEPEEYAEHYETGGSKPEDFVDDDRVLPLGDALPRCAFLLEGLREKVAA